MKTSARDPKTSSKTPSNPADSTVTAETRSRTTDPSGNLFLHNRLEHLTNSAHIAERQQPYRAPFSPEDKHPYRYKPVAGRELARGEHKDPKTGNITPC